jgi:hypothetical protein
MDETQALDTLLELHYQLERSRWMFNQFAHLINTVQAVSGVSLPADVKDAVRSRWEALGSHESGT